MNFTIYHNFIKHSSPNLDLNFVQIKSVVEDALSESTFVGRIVYKYISRCSILIPSIQVKDNTTRAAELESESDFKLDETRLRLLFFYTHMFHF